MALDIPAVQAALRADGLDGWLLFDFYGSNPIATSLVGLAGSGKLTTRRWFYLIPREGEPRGLVHAIEHDVLDGVPGMKLTYSGRHELAQGLDRLLEGIGRLAMEYSPDCEIPYVSRVDAGTVDAVRRRVADVVSSGDLAQRFEARWSDRQLASHRDASDRLHRIKDRTFEFLADELRRGRPVTESTLQQQMMAWFAEERLVTDAPPVVAAEENARLPHYSPDAHSRPIHRDELVLVDLWGKLADPGSVFADITWMGFTGARVPEPYARAFAVVREARDAAIQLVECATREGRELHGWEVDRWARDVVEAAGFGPYFIHRTGHNLGEQVHGNGVHLDDYETHDTRRLLPGTGFTIEPGLYFETFGVRTEVNMYVGAGDAWVTGDRQVEIATLG